MKIVNYTFNFILLIVWMQTILHIFWEPIVFFESGGRLNYRIKMLSNTFAKYGWPCLTGMSIHKLVRN